MDALNCARRDAVHKTFEMLTCINMAFDLCTTIFNVYHVLGLGFEAQVLGLDLGLGLCVLDSNTDNTSI